MKKIVAFSAIFCSLAMGLASAQGQEAPSAERSLVRFMVWSEERPKGAKNPFALLQNAPRPGSGLNAAQMMRFLQNVASRDGARIREITKRLDENNPWAGEEPPFEDRPENVPQSDEDAYIYLLFRPGQAPKLEGLTRSQQADRTYVTDVNRRRGRVAKILATCYGDRKALLAISVAAQCLAYKEADEQVSLADMRSMLAILVRNPSQESLKTIVRILTPSDDTWVDERVSQSLRWDLAQFMAEPEVVARWLPLLRKIQLVDHQQVVLDRLIKDFDRIRAKGQPDAPPPF